MHYMWSYNSDQITPAFFHVVLFFYRWRSTLCPSIDLYRLFKSVWPIQHFLLVGILTTVTITRTNSIINCAWSIHRSLLPLINFKPKIIKQRVGGEICSRLPGMTLILNYNPITRNWIDLIKYMIRSILSYR